VCQAIDKIYDSVAQVREIFVNDGRNLWICDSAMDRLFVPKVNEVIEPERRLANRPRLYPRGLLEDQFVAGRDRAGRLPLFRNSCGHARWRRARRIRGHCEHHRNHSKNRGILRSVSQDVVAGISGIRTVNQLNTADDASDALRLRANLDGMYFDVLNACANSAVVGRLIQIERGMSDCGTIHIPSRMLANDNLMIDLAGL
jgi:hypothetical protein